MGGEILLLLPVLFHRIGLILSVVGATILVLLPTIYTQQEDRDFASRLSSILIVLTRSGLVLLVLTGLIRLYWGLPGGFVFKALAVAATLYWAFFQSPSYPSEEYLRHHLILLALICLTAVIGILL